MEFLCGTGDFCIGNDLHRLDCFLSTDKTIGLLFVVDWLVRGVLRLEVPVSLCVLVVVRVAHLLLVVEHGLVVGRRG